MGGSGLGDSLAAVNDPVSGLRGEPGWHLPGELTPETFGLRPPGDPHELLTPVGARAVARTRAAAGGAVELVMMLADDPRADLGDWDLPATDHLLYALGGLRRGGVPAAEGDAWDRGLEAVLEAARRLGHAPLPAPDLFRTAVLAGGTGPLALLDAAADRSD